MPMPTPNQGEDNQNFINRCMSDSVMVSDFQDTEQRYAVCQRQWEDNPPEQEESKPEQDNQVLSSERHTIRLSAQTITNPSFQVDKENGCINGVSICSLGPAIGHGFSIDGDFLSDVATIINSKSKGVKVHLGHPDTAIEDGSYSLVGKIGNARVEDNRTVGNVKLRNYADSSPKGKLKQYLLDIASEDPDAIGLSIVFEYEVNEEGKMKATDIVSVDFVDEPAANRNGLLEKKDNMEKVVQLEPQNNIQTTVDIQGGKEMSETNDVVQLDSKVEQDKGIRLERERVSQIRSLCQKTNTEDLIDSSINDGLSVDAVKEMVIEKLANKNKPVSTIRVEVGEDLNRSSLQTALVDHFTVRTGGRVEKPHDRTRELVGLSAVEVARKVLETAGVSTVGWSRGQIARTALSRRIALTHTTSDFANILVSASNKSLQQLYREANTSWQLWCNKATAPDFKTVNRAQLNAFASLAAVIEGDEYLDVTVTDRKETYSLSKYGKIFNLSWESIVNDELGAWERMPQMWANSCGRLCDATAFGVLTTNGTMSDSVALFYSTHSNLEATTAYLGAPSVATLNRGKGVMRKQTAGATGAYLDIVPKFLLVPAELEGVSEQLVTSPTDPTATYNAANIWAGNKLTVISSAVLSGSSTTGWYLAADPKSFDTVELCFLEGEETPQISEEDDFDTDARKFKVRFCVAGAALDYRGLYSNPGA